MMFWTLVLVADMVAGEGARVKKLRRKEMVAVVARAGSCLLEKLLLSTREEDVCVERTYSVVKKVYICKRFGICE
jgi:hypothetical protein